MRACEAGAVLGLTAVVLTGCTQGHINAWRPEVPDLAHPTAERYEGPDFAHPTARRYEVADLAHPSAVRPEVPDLAHPSAHRYAVGDYAHPTARRLAIPDFSHTGGPGQVYGGPHTKQLISSGSGEAIFFDGERVRGDVADITPSAVRFADGLAVPRVDLEGLRFADGGDLPALGDNPLHDATALRDGPVIEGAVLGLDGQTMRIAVYDTTGVHVETVNVADVRAVRLRDRRDSPCERGALLVANGPAANTPVAVIDSRNLDRVYVNWIVSPDGAQPDRVLRCYPRTRGASACNIVQWGAGDPACDSSAAAQVYGLTDNVGFLSESTPFYYALRDGERTLGVSNVIVRDREHSHLRPAHITTHSRGAAHYWEPSTRAQRARELQTE